MVKGKERGEVDNVYFSEIRKQIRQIIEIRLRVVPPFRALDKTIHQLIDRQFRRREAEGRDIALEGEEALDGVGFGHVGQEHGGLIGVGLFGILFVCGEFVRLGLWGGGGGGGKGELTYGDSKDEGFEEGVVGSEGVEDVGVAGDVDEDCEGVFGNGPFGVSEPSLGTGLVGAYSVVLDK